jgi:hypothetical protein
MYQVALRLMPLPMLRPSAKQLRWFSGALIVIAFVLALFFSPQDPDGYHPEKQAPTPEPFSMAQTVSPTTVNPFNQCSGGPHFSVGEFKLH